MKDRKDYDMSEFFENSKEDEKYFTWFNYIKKEIYSRFINLPPISRRITFRDNGDITILEYLIHNEKEKGIINNIFSLENDTINVTTYIVTFKNKKFCRNIVLYSRFFEEDDKDYFEMFSENKKSYLKEEIKKEEIVGRTI